MSQVELEYTSLDYDFTQRERIEPESAELTLTPLKTLEEESEELEKGKYQRGKKDYEDSMEDESGFEITKAKVRTAMDLSR